MKPNVKDIREALKNNCLYVYAYVNEGTHAHRRIIDVKEKHGRVYGRLLFEDKWVRIASWFQQ
jgi:pimeloyl-CoA synthetase